MNDIEQHNKIKLLYHGTTKRDFIPNPNYNNPDNDYGSGLYMTDNLDRALEWSRSIYTNENKGYAYTYEINFIGLKVLDLSKASPLVWVAVLTSFRKLTGLSPFQEDDILKLKETYYIDVNSYDVIYGYRADDTYSKIAYDFINNFTTVDILEKALILGKFGLQYCLKSEEAFNRLKFVNRVTAKQEHAVKFSNMDKKARIDYEALRKQRIGNKFLRDFI